jgi:5-amino-6-(5-phosphoribosylamino)uracil reductase
VSVSAAVWLERFTAFVARKEAEAEAAQLPPYATETDQGGEIFDRIESAWTRNFFGGPFYVSRPADRRLPATSLVFVQSRDGNTGAADPSAIGGGDTDKHLIYEGLSRLAADGVLAGAETIRGGHPIFSTWLPELVALRASLGLPRHPIQMIATLRGIAFDDALIFNVPDLRVVLLTTPTYVAAMHHALSQRPWITPVVMDDPNDLRGAFAQFRALGIQRISCVGGRTIARQLIDAGLVQDLYLTTSPKAGGEPNTALYPGPLQARTIVRKHGTGAEDGVVFEHLALG